MTFSLRSDRVATIYLGHLLSRMLRAGERRAVPILMYHSISDIAESAPHPFYQTTTDPVTFRTHMEWLERNGYRAIPLQRISEELAISASEKGKPFALTFDDGFRDFRENAWPIMQRFGFTATVFLATGFVGRKWIDKECLAWEEIRQLKGEGIDFGSHTVSHPKLHGMPLEFIERELRDSKAAIEDATGIVVESFSFPFAFPQEDRSFVTEFAATLKRCGYNHGVTTCVGRFFAGQATLFMNRIPLNMHDDEALLRAKMEGGYDWFRSAQYTFRLIKKWF